MNKKILVLTLTAGLSVSGMAGAREINLVQNPGFDAVSPSTNTPGNYELKGAATWGRLGGPDNMTTNGVIFPGDAPSGGAASQFITGIDQSKGRWITFSFRGLAED